MVSLYIEKGVTLKRALKKVLQSAINIENVLNSREVHLKRTLKRF